MKRLGMLMLLAGLPVAQAYEIHLRAGTETEARVTCHGLLGENAKLTKIQHLTRTKPGKADFITFKYVEADCVDRNVDDWEAAELVAQALSHPKSLVQSYAVVELNKLDIYTESILTLAVAALDISQIDIAKSLFVYLADGGKKTVSFLQARLNDPNSSIRYKAALTFHWMALDGETVSLYPVLPDLERLYFAEHSENGFMDPYPLGVKINVAGVFGRLPGKAPRSLVDKMVSDLTDWELMHEYVNSSYEGPMQLGPVLVKTLGRIGEPAVPFLEDALLENDGGPFVNGESFPLLAAEAMGVNAKGLLPTLERILAEGKTPYPTRVQLAIDRISSQLAGTLLDRNRLLGIVVRRVHTNEDRFTVQRPVLVRHVLGDGNEIAFTDLHPLFADQYSHPAFEHH